MRRILLGTMMTVLLLPACGGRPLASASPSASALPLVLRLMVDPDPAPCHPEPGLAETSDVVSVGLTFGTYSELAAAEVGASFCQAGHRWTLVSRQLVGAARDLRPTHVLESLWRGDHLLAVVESPVD